MTNKRYTDIDALIAMLRNNIDLPFNGSDNWAHIVQIKDKLIEHIEKNAPVADVTGVVRCGQCRYYDERTTNSNGFEICPASGMEIHENDYCSYGEKGRKGE